jgi:hypothetical protein
VDIIEVAREHVARSVNTAMVQAYRGQRRTTLVAKVSRRFVDESRQT